VVIPGRFDCRIPRTVEVRNSVEIRNSEEHCMPSRTVKVASRVGLHARPASLFVQAVNATGLPVTIAKSGGDPVDARSILMVMGLGVGNNDEVTLEAEGDGADEALDQLVQLLEVDHDAPA
jgi:phosphocarrier protein HPr